MINDMKLEDTFMPPGLLTGERKFCLEIKARGMPATLKTFIIIYEGKIYGKLLKN